MSKQDKSIGDEKTLLKRVSNTEQSLGDMPTQKAPGDSDLSMGELPTIVGANASGAAQLDSVELSDLYDVQGEIGHGGFATVYKAVDKKSGQEVAIKRLKTEAADEQSVRRFKREARLIAEMDHPNIIGVHRIGEDSDGLYIVMEYVSGGSLKDYLKQHGKMNVRQAVKLVQAVCEGLAYAHRKNLIHRDIKPANILLKQSLKTSNPSKSLKSNGDLNELNARSGLTPLTPVIADFGLSTGGFESDMSMSLSMSGTTMGTPYYMPPEQRQSSKNVNHTADIYAIGKTLYQMVTGDVPDNVDPDLIPRPAGLKRIINQCVKTNPEERFFSMDDLVKALDTLVQRRRVVRPILVVLLVMAAAGGFLGLRWKEQRDVALAEQARIEQMATEQQKKIGDALTAAQEAFSSKEYAMASEQVAVALAIDSENSTALKLKDGIRLAVGMNEAIPAQTAAESALENVRALNDKWPGYSEEIGRLESDLKNGNKFYDQHEYGVAMERYGLVKAGCAELEKQEKLRQVAVDSKEKMEAARKAAESQNAEELAQGQWEKSLDMTFEATQAFEEGRFAEAATSWEAAAEGFQSSRAMAIAVSEYRKVKEKWNLAKKDHKETQNEIERYAAEEWVAAKNSADLGATSENEPIVGKKHYETALEKYAEALKKAEPYLVPKSEMSGELRPPPAGSTSSQEKVPVQVERTDKVPVLGDIPIFGRLFRAKTTQTEFVVVDMKGSYYVQGEVNRPQQYSWSGGKRTLLQAISEAGGFTDFADPKHVEVIRDGNTERYDVKAIIKNPALDVPLQNGDVIKVSRRIF